MTCFQRQLGSYQGSNIFLSTIDATLSEYLDDSGAKCKDIAPKLTGVFLSDCQLATKCC